MRGWGSQSPNDRSGCTSLAWASIRGHEMRSFLAASLAARAGQRSGALPLVTKTCSPRKPGEFASPPGMPFLGPMDDAAPAPIVLPSGHGARRRRIAAKTIRLHDKEHCKFLASQPCVERPLRRITYALPNPPRARTQSQRRIHGPRLPAPSPRIPRLWR
jgi:hypothetical protein